ncbi:MAG: hypothetical protein IKC65_07705 [Lentisphaeria bacterium]|nr:hypothetical protein [Lentisphaeria bacterium]
MTGFKQWFSGFCTAWEMLIDRPLPRRLTARVQGCSPTSLQIAAGFALTGITVGALLALLCGLLHISWLNHYVASGLFAAAAVFLAEYKDSGRGLRLLLSCIRRKLDDYDWIEAATEASAEDRSLEKSAGTLSAMLILLLEFICFALLAFHRASLWCIPLFSGAFTIQMLFATLPRKMNMPPYLPIPENRKKAIWILPGLIALTTFFIFPAAAIAAAAIVGGLGTILHKNFILTAAPVTSDLITLSGKITELILLLAGVIFIL